MRPRKRECMRTAKIGPYLRLAWNGLFRPYTLLVIYSLCFLYSSSLAATDANKGQTTGNRQRELQVFSIF